MTDEDFEALTLAAASFATASTARMCKTTAALIAHARELRCVLAMVLAHEAMFEGYMATGGDNRVPLEVSHDTTLAEIRRVLGRDGEEG